MQNVINVTPNEVVLLKAIRETGKRMGVDAAKVAVPYENPFPVKQVGSGTFASALRKGLVGTQDYGTKDHAVWLTKAALKVLSQLP